MVDVERVPIRRRAPRFEVLAASASDQVDAGDAVRAGRRQPLREPVKVAAVARQSVHAHHRPLLRRRRRRRRRRPFPGHTCQLGSSNLAQASLPRTGEVAVLDGPFQSV